MNTTAFEMVKEFHNTFGHAVNDEPTTPDAMVMKLRINLILEEVAELIEAIHAECTVPQSVLPAIVEQLQVTMQLINAAEDREFQPDHVDVADALTDILYVVNGAGLVFGLNLDDTMKEVHRSNMSKLGADGAPIYNQFGKILKGEGYTPPDLESVIYGEEDAA